MEPLLNFFLIDDSAFDLFIYEKLLIKSGITNSVKTFNSARDALKYLVTQADTLPDTVILLDLQMPDMNGFEFIDEFDQLSDGLRQKVRIFMLSSTIDTRDIEKAKASQHIIDLLPKPLEIPFLKKKLAI
ncbi:response regulator [Dyadobacter fermentans]|uniref:Response regulator receiver protein n=1 Tax=Dyadobacter fermentans (strain ATCC 700827 / DSM 18053 / CIP 107007 / KCTC 52180 / NS114) TaxID=471854 RepID=C6W0K5_DYAFD|nr:response regulator [Dyadobacter fermentans]ACT93611.1 response regulator receiver protein [Dyadobacter fermentans DSM 18053]